MSRFPTGSLVASRVHLLAAFSEWPPLGGDKVLRASFVDAVGPGDVLLLLGLRRGGAHVLTPRGAEAWVNAEELALV